MSEELTTSPTGTDTSGPDGRIPPDGTASLSYPTMHDFAWDTMPPDRRNRLVLEQAVRTALFAKAYVPFYRAQLAHLSEHEISKIASLEEFACLIPETTKQHLSTNPFWAFVPDQPWRERDEYRGGFRNKGTGGTTGRSVNVIYASEDWRAQAATIARTLRYDFDGREDVFDGLRIVGLYHGDHITNELFQAGYVRLGMDMFTRPSTKSDPRAMYDFLQEVRPHAILAPPEDPNDATTKGLTLDKLLHIDARNAASDCYRLNARVNPEFQMVFWSSLPMSKQMQDYIIEHLGVPYQWSATGSTEVGVIACTCRHFVRDFHLTYGTGFTVVKHATEPRLTDEEEEGYVLVSKTASLTHDGSIVPPGGTVLLNFRTGDFARLWNRDGTQKCPCGRNTPVLKGAHRREEQQAKAIFGCQAD